MSVSAVELELSKILDSDQHVSFLYEEKMGDSLPTFGTLIHFFFDNIDDAALSPHLWLKEFKLLLDLCNKYRIFSVHPKGKKVGHNVATSVLHLTFEFFSNKPA
jgi:hypothetical protein